MANPQKEILRQLATYMKIVNAHLEDFDKRLAALEDPARAPFGARRFSPGPSTQLQTIEAAIQRLPD